MIFCSSYHVSLRTVIAHTGHSIRYFLLFSCPRCPRRPFSLLGLPHGQMRALYLRSQTSIHWLCNICHLVSARLFGVWLLDASKTRAISNTGLHVVAAVTRILSLLSPHSFFACFSAVSLLVWLIKSERTNQHQIVPSSPTNKMLVHRVLRILLMISTRVATCTTSSRAFLFLF